MKWVRLHNSGNFDVVTAINMIGASVKTSDDPIGLYGSGVKYAMAQCIRENINLKISDAGKVYTLTSKNKTFRGEDFEMVCLKSSTGRMHETGITSEFGREDWNEKWFVFREFYSNMLDESGSFDIVDGIVTHDSGVDVFLPYNVFKDIVDNIDHWFTDRSWDLRPGNGRLFKKGVYIGQLEGCNFDFQSSNIGITETRTVDKPSARLNIVDYFYVCKNVDHWKLLFESDKDFLENIGIEVSSYRSKEYFECIHDALTAVHGNYLICPPVADIIADVSALGYVPVVFPSAWRIPAHELLRDLKNIESNLIYQQISNEQQNMIDRALELISDFVTIDVGELNIQIFKTDEGILGQTNKKRLIELSDRNFEDIKLLSQTLLHEINHIQTQEGDYSRGFAEAYEKYIIHLMT